MKISKILAGMSAAALAASMMSLAAFADETATVKADLTGGTVSLIDEKDDDGVVTKTGVLTGTNVNVTVGADSAAKIEAGDWIGGGLGYNSESTGWASTEWSFQEGAKDVTGVKADDGSYDFVLKGTDPVFADTDTFAQVWLQNWTTEDFTFNAFTLLDKDGNPLLVVESDKAQGGNTVDLSAYDATEVTLAGNGKAKVDTGKVRVNVNNPWGEDVDKLITPADFEGVDAIAVTAEFDAITDPVDFAINFAIFSDNGPQYWGEGNAANKGCSTEAVTVNADGSYTFLLKFDEPLTVDGDLFLDLQSAFEAATDDDIPFAAKVTSVKALTLKDAPAPSESTADSTESTDSDESKVILTDSSDSKTNSAATSSKAANNASNTNPSTGAAALAAVGVALAGAAVVATKKRK